MHLIPVQVHTRPLKVHIRGCDGVNTLDDFQYTSIKFQEDVSALGHTLQCAPCPPIALGCTINMNIISDSAVGRVFYISVPGRMVMQSIAEIS